ncbi:MAG: hypothetical protein ACOCW2_02005 [Chitinivibrionales bacterium]
MSRSLQDTPPSAGSSRAQTILLRLAYIATLSRLSEEQLREFWLTRSGLTDTLYDEKNLYQMLWDADSWVDLSAQMNAIERLEEYLLSYTIELPELIGDTIRNVTCGSLIPARYILLWCKPMLAKLSSVLNPHETIIEMFGCIARRVTPHLQQRYVLLRKKGRHNTVTMVLMKRRPVMGSRKKVVLDTVAAFDCRSWLLVPLQLTPQAFGIPPFTDIQMISDVRRCETVVPKHRCRIDGDTFLIDDYPYGTVEPFNVFCDRKGYADQPFLCRDDSVVVMKENFVCPWRNRIVLNRGCCYGAPVYLYSLKYASTRQSTPILSRLIDMAFGQVDYGRMNEVERRHHELIASLDGGVNFVYTGRTESLAINGAHVVRYTPAKILRRVVRDYLQSGRSIFSYREFINDREIILDPNRPNMNVRINRLISTIQKACPQVRIHKRERGQFEFRCDVRIHYREQK